MAIKDYQAFADGTMNILVDGKVQRRHYDVQMDGAPRSMNEFVPHTSEGEQIVRYADGGMEIITFATGAG